jgi:ureidoglycolate hydrolase
MTDDARHASTTRSILALETLDPDKFRPFGMILEPPDTENRPGAESQFSTLAKINASGWALASSFVRNRAIDRIAQHPSTAEAFIPISGCPVIVVAEYERPGELRAFVLDRPVLIKEKIWHSTLTLTRTSEIRIVENAEVTAESKLLGCRLEPTLSEGP